MIAQSTYQLRNNLPSNLHVVIGLYIKLDWHTNGISRFWPLTVDSLQDWPEQLATDLNCKESEE